MRTVLTVIVPQWLVTVGVATLAVVCRSIPLTISAAVCATVATGTLVAVACGLRAEERS